MNRVGRACDLPVDHQSQQDVVEAEYEVVFNELDHHRDARICSNRMERAYPADAEIHLMNNRGCSTRSISVLDKLPY